MEACLARWSSGSAIFRAIKAKSLHFKSPNPLRCSVPIHSGGIESVKRAYDALLLDAGGTLLQLVVPVEETYASIGSKYGLTVTPSEIKKGFKRAFAASWPEKLRYQGDGRPFWKLVVSEATGCDNADYFEEVYEVRSLVSGILAIQEKAAIIDDNNAGITNKLKKLCVMNNFVQFLRINGFFCQYYAKGDAWRLPEEAYETLIFLKDAGVKMAVVSNFDTRLRKLLKELNVLDKFDAIIISSEVGYEKPDANIFKAALDQINVKASRAVHVGDDHEADKIGANAIGIDCWLWGVNVKSFSDIQSRILITPS